MTLVVLYCGTSDRGDAWSMLLRLLPVILLMGAAIGVFSTLLLRWYYKKYHV